MNTDQSIIYTFDRRDVEACNFGDFIARYGRENLPDGTALKAMVGSLSILIEGYNDDSREVYEIPEIRTFHQRLNREWPYLLFFSSIRPEILWPIVICQVPINGALKSDATAHVAFNYDAPAVVRVLQEGFSGMNELCEAAGMSGREIDWRTYDIFQCFRLPALPPKSKRP